MATPTVKSTYVMDLETAETLDRLAREWQVSKSEALRRAIRSAAAGDAPDRVTLFHNLQQSAGVTREKAARWVASVRAERAGIPRRRSARRR
jgi:Ribbon-helix-helix protein, copG family